MVRSSFLGHPLGFFSFFSSSLKQKQNKKLKGVGVVFPKDIHITKNSRGGGNPTPPAYAPDQSTCIPPKYHNNTSAGAEGTMFHIPQEK